MRKFKVTVTQEKKYEIEIDENKMTEEKLDSFEEFFYDLDQEDDRIKSMANNYCRLRAIGLNGNIEGYGYVLEDGEVPLEAQFYDFEKKDINTGINFKIIDEDEDEEYADIEVEEIS